MSSSTTPPSCYRELVDQPGQRVVVVHRGAAAADDDASTLPPPPSQSFPLVLAPATDADATSATLLRLLACERRELLERTRTHGAVLFRGWCAAEVGKAAADGSLATPLARVFALAIGGNDDADDADADADANAHADAVGLSLPMCPYVGGAAVRTRVVGTRVFTANESPPDELIPFHHEMAQVPQPPDYVAFCCERAPTPADAAPRCGQTPLVRSDVVAAYVEREHPRLFAALRRRGLRYVRVMPRHDDPTSPIGRSWPATFVPDAAAAAAAAGDNADGDAERSLRARAETAMRTLGTTFEWLDDGALRTTTAVVPGVRVDSRSGTTVFFNSLVAAWTGWNDARNSGRTAVRLGPDGDGGDGGADGGADDASCAFDDEQAAAIDDVVRFMREQRSMVPWHAGDILLVDNTTCMHSREPFTPPRRVIAAIALRPDASQRDSGRRQ